jgi:NADH-quinone oxidoreductase subunit G
MPTLVIDNQEVEVPAGTKVIEAAEKLGIMIPRFCFHPALGSVGACRVCAVKFLAGPVAGIQMSCMVTALDGMVVSTTDPEAVDFRRQVIEWLMLHHPHDCPVCDEGGHCLLQDTTISGGHGLRRYRGAKRTYPDQDLGPLVRHEMNRCIHCYRCVRFYQEFAGCFDLGAMQIANRVYFGRFADGPLESPFAGNLIDICPTGVFTDKPSRYFGRRWDYQRAPSVCLHCSLGCRTVASARYRQTVRQEAGRNPAVNGHFICDRGRYGFFYADHPRRPRQARVGEAVKPLTEAVAFVRQELGRIARSAGPDAIGTLGGLRSSLETQAFLARLCRASGWRPPAFFNSAGLAARVAAAVAGLSPELATSLGEIEDADAVIVVGADPLNEAPMLALALRQAQRRGAPILVADPRPVRLPLAFQHLPLPPEALAAFLGAAVKDALPAGAAQALGDLPRAFWQALPAASGPAAAHVLAESRRPLIVCGTETVPAALPALAADCARLLAVGRERCGLFYLLPGAGAFAAARVSPPGASLEALLEAIEAGRITALVVVEADPLSDFPDRPRLERALAQLELLVVLDHLPSVSAARAQVLLPTATIFEAGGILVNQEGRVQWAQPVLTGGIPVAQSGAGGHPPRDYAAGLPGGEPTPAWRFLAQLAGDARAADVGNLAACIAEVLPEFANLPRPAALPLEGIRLPLGGAAPFTSPTGEPAAAGPDGLTILLTQQTFGTETLSALSPPLEALEQPPRVALGPQSAEALGLASGDRLVVNAAGGCFEATLAVCAHTAPGVLVVPRHRDLNWQLLGPSGTRIPLGHIRRTEDPHAAVPQGRRS